MHCKLLQAIQQKCKLRDFEYAEIIYVDLHSQNEIETHKTSQFHIFRKAHVILSDRRSTISSSSKLTNFAIYNKALAIDQITF